MAPYVRVRYAKLTGSYRHAPLFRGHMPELPPKWSGCTVLYRF
jgi:hypothetical protein